MRLSRDFAVTVRTQTGTEYKSATRDISARGVFFYCPAELAEQSNIELVMMLPSEITGGQRQWVCAAATVVRLEKDASGGLHGIAARIERLQLLPELEA